MSDPLKNLHNIADENQIDINGAQFAKLMDEKDVLKGFRELFEYPKMKTVKFVDSSKVNPEEDCIYLCGNSLGLMPKRVRETMGQLMQQWADLGVYGHHYGDHPWYICDEELLASMCRLVGASTDEVAIMNQLTSSLHFLLLTFYRPTKSKFKILFEYDAFPSDHYTFESQVRLHGLDPSSALIALRPREGEYILRSEDILETIKCHGEQISVICFSGTQYYTGQCFNIPLITKCGHDVGAYVGWDLAHSVGNIELNLHDWDVDFAVWTTYKYLNAGAGNTGAAFLHSRLFTLDLPYLTGWWGNKIETRMMMKNQIEPGEGIRKFRMSTPSALHCAALRASLEIFDMTDMETIRTKSVSLTAYLEYLLNQINVNHEKTILEIITPSQIDQRGAQLSIICLDSNIDDVHMLLKENGIVCDHRKPNVIRLAPCPLYNSYWDVFKASELINNIFKKT